MPTLWETAKRIEQEGRERYEALARDSANEHIAAVFSLLAREEQRHYDLFNSLEQSMPPEAAATRDIRADVNTLFASLRDDSRPEGAGLETMEDAEDQYARALKVEQESIAFYENALNRADTGMERASIGEVLAEERRHERIVRSLMEYVARPREWVENAEFYHLEDY